MPLLPLEQLLTHVDSKYRLVIIAAKRAKQLMRGGEPLITQKSFKPTYIALEEVAAGKLIYEAEPAEGAAAKGLAGPEHTPTWFRSLSAVETLAEGVTVEEEEEEGGGAEIEEAPPKLRAESSEETEEAELTDLDAPEEPAAEEGEV